MTHRACTRNWQSQTRPNLGFQTHDNQIAYRLKSELFTRRCAGYKNALLLRSLNVSPHRVFQRRQPSHTQVSLAEILVAEKTLKNQHTYFANGNLRICTRRAGKLYKVRPRLYRSQILQVTTHWKALAEIYTKHLNRIPRWKEMVEKKKMER